MLVSGVRLRAGKVCERFRCQSFFEANVEERFLWLMDFQRAETI